jgi:double-stranded uracil-DNA glycosylase
MAELSVAAISEAAGLRRESSLDPTQLPLWLARLHRALPVGDTVRFTLTGSLPVPFDSMLEGAGFCLDNGNLVRLETLPDIVSGGMRVLVCGLNPSPHAADSGVPFSRPGNRFWPAAIAGGLLRRDRDPYDALASSRVGFTDLVKRTTARADELTASEFRSGVARIERLVRWLQPSTLLIVGLSGWRHGLDRTAEAGWQKADLGETPVYLMPNTSGLNARETLDSLGAHVRAAVQGRG